MRFWRPGNEALEVWEWDSGGLGIRPCKWEWDSGGLGIRIRSEFLQRRAYSTQLTPLKPHVLSCQIHLAYTQKDCNQIKVFYCWFQIASNSATRVSQRVHVYTCTNVNKIVFCILSIDFARLISFLDYLSSLRALFCVENSLNTDQCFIVTFKSENPLFPLFRTRSEKTNIQNCIRAIWMLISDIHHVFMPLSLRELPRIVVPCILCLGSLPFPRFLVTFQSSNLIGWVRVY